MLKLCREHGRFVHEVFPEVFGNKFTPEEFVTWQAYDFLRVCSRFEIDSREYDKLEDVIKDVNACQAKETLKMKKLAEGSYGS